MLTLILITTFWVSTLDTRSKPHSFSLPLMNTKLLILEWNKPYGIEIPYNNYTCTMECIFTRDRAFETNATLITFHYPELRDVPKTSSLSRMNVFISIESPGNYMYADSIPDDYFNISLTYRQDSDISIPYDSFQMLMGNNDQDKWKEGEVNFQFTITTLTIPSSRGHFVVKSPIAGINSLDILEMGLSVNLGVPT